MVNKNIEDIHVEVIEFHCYSALKETASDSRGSILFTNLPGRPFPKTIQFDYHLYAVFRNTYLCYQFLSFMERNTTSEMSRLTDTDAMNLLLIRKFKPDITRNNAVFREICLKVLISTVTF